jgi:Ni2+-binding GTPase involved in maturation of urease and hydrogenase/very-short-patch-repair endonuclease
MADTDVTSGPLSANQPMDRQDQNERGVMQPEHDPLLRDQVVRLMGVLRQLAVAKNRPIRHTSRYDEVLWLDDVQDHCTVQAPEGPGDELLRAARVPREAPPVAPPVLKDWLVPSKDDLREPVLRERALLDGNETSLDDAPGIRGTYEAWIRALWRPWADRERARRPRQRVFETMFDLSRLAADRPESIELVLSSGLLHVPGSDDDAGLRVHLVTQPVRVEQDSETGEMVCRLAEDVGVRLEDDELLSGLPIFDASGAVVLRERLLELAESPVAPGVAAFLKEWVPRALTITCDVEDTWVPPVGKQARLVVAPALVARRRGAFALRAYYDAIVKDLKDEQEPVPLGLAQLVRSVEPHDRISWLERSGASAPADLAADPLFPLPANEEQGRIIERLGSDTGVVVEGPPGTGKTHTIANLVSALLAQGQRVLVTSEKAQALRVLRDKLPKGMQELCVSITDASPKGNSDLAKSVATMAGQRTEFNPNRADRRIADLTARRADAQRRREALLEDIRLLRESETYQHPEISAGYSGTLAQIARTIAETAEHDGWVPGYARGELPLSAAEFAELLHLLRTVNPERRSRLEQRLPAPAQLMPAERFAALVAMVRQGDAVRSGDDGSLVALLEALPAERLLRLEAVCTDVLDASLQVRRLPALARWALLTSDMLLVGNGGHLWNQATAQLGSVDAAREHDRKADFARVHVAASVDAATAATVFERFATHLAGGGTVRKVFKSQEQKDAERIGDAVLVNGTVPTTGPAAAAAGHHLRVLEIARRIDAAFRPLQMGLALDAERPVLIDAMIGLQRACASVDRLQAAAAALRELLGVLPPHSRPDLSTVPALERVAATASAVTRARSAAVAQAEIDESVSAVFAHAPTGERAPETVALIDAMRGLDVEGYGNALAGLERARVQQAEQRRCDELWGRLRAASITLAEDLAATATDPIWTTRQPRWLNAWARACAASWIVEQTAPGREQRLDAELNASVTELHKLTGELAAEKAWRSCLGRMSAEQVQALQSYRNAMNNVGKGTGKYAERFRRAARDAMAVAQSAVPAWVMPIQQVLASVPPQADTFDVVIVDEASQADLTSAFLLWLAPRVIVVGDDKQCTPSEVASGALQPVFDRLDAELHDIPSYLRAAYTPKDSIFSLLRSRFGQVVRLREHFRCMPEIITWSSDMFYQDAPLVPLRQFGADRLPPLRTTFVADAEVEPLRGSIVNRAEAAAIAESVAACISDPAYDGRTFGVVVLQGQPQVDLIDQELKKRVSDTDWTERRLRIGTPPDFQGDERHVVWLSMVTAPNAPRSTFTRRSFEQSYNVAASRAQDQLWLFHSVSPEDLSPADLRYSLLTYMSSEATAAIDPVLNDVEPDRVHSEFDCLFEQRVFLDLVHRGYHVTPQVESNRRRIDLVVTGKAGKLAVECDGEAFHTTAEARAADLAREQELKRCGWTFERIRESRYHLDREAALAPVWAALDRLGIEPLGELVDGTWVPRPDIVTAEPTTRWDATVVDEPHPSPEPDPDPADVEPQKNATGAPLPPVTPTPSLMPEPLATPPWSYAPLERPDIAAGVPIDDAAAADLNAAAVAVAPPTDDVSPEMATSTATSPAAAPSDVPLIHDVDIDVDDRDLLLRAAAQRPLSTNWVAETLAISTYEARALLQSLVEDGLLRRTGQTKGTRYVLPEWTEAERPPQSQAERPRRFVLGPNQRMLVLRAARHRPLTNENVRRLLDVSSGQAVEVLSALVQEGLLERKGRGRGTYYVLEARPARDQSMVEHTPTDLASEFDREMRRLYERALHEAGYKATRFLSMLSEHGGVATARQLLAAGSVSGGFTELWERRRLDLTVEALVLQSRFEPLFRDSEREAARHRLSSYGFILRE